MTIASPKPVLYIDMDNTLVDFRSAFPRVDAAALAEYEGNEDDMPGIFALMDPMDRAVESVHVLAEHYDVYVLSTAPWANASAWSDKLGWIKRHFGSGPDSVLYKRVILSHRKDLNRGAVLIDDRPGKNGAGAFPGRVIAFGSDAHPDWPSVVAHLTRAGGPIGGNGGTSWDAGIQVALAKAIATLAHQGQTDKLGAAYIAHPARVAYRFDPDLAPLEHCAAWLHDVIEDTAYTADDLLATGVHPDVVSTVLLLTRDTSTPPEEYYRRIAADRVALAVKAADIEDNLSPARTALLDDATRERLAAKYEGARRHLEFAPEGIR